MAHRSQVAAAKGLISGPIDLILRDGAMQSCNISGDTVCNPVFGIRLIQLILVGHLGAIYQLDTEDQLSQYPVVVGH